MAIATRKTFLTRRGIPRGRARGARLAFVKSLGLVKSNISVADVVDMSFARAAVAELGPYRKDRAG